MEAEGRRFAATKPGVSPLTKTPAQLFASAIVTKAAVDDRVFHALADGTRRDILLRTLERHHNVSALARLYPMSFAAVQKHVAVLEGAGLVTKERKGREQLVLGNVATMRKAYRLLEQLEAVWTDRIDRIGEMLAGEHNGGQEP